MSALLLSPAFRWLPWLSWLPEMILRAVPKKKVSHCAFPLPPQNFQDLNPKPSPQVDAVRAQAPPREDQHRDLSRVRPAQAEPLDVPQLLWRNLKEVQGGPSSGPRACHAESGVTMYRIYSSSLPS
jgi:hypothetical protein